jgi:tetratricopeptide (TPR) repeat protein
VVDPNNKDAYNNLGAALREQGDLNEAVASIQRALEIDQNYKEGYLNLGLALRARGDLEEAITHIQHALKIDPGYAEAHNALSSLVRHTEFDEQMRTMEALISRRGLADNQKMHLYFGLGKACEDIKEYGKAFGYLMQGNRLKRATVEYTTSDTREFFEKIKNVFSRDFISHHEGVGFRDDTPIFIVGMPRSGTSLAEQILASHPQVFGAGELRVLSSLTTKRCGNESGSTFPECIPDLDFKAFEALGSDYVKAIREYAQTSRHITDKMPHNFIYVGLIKLILPNAKVIHCTRDPMDNCLSIFKNYFGGPHPYAYDMGELGDYYRLYQDLMEHMRQMLPDYMYELRYEELVSDQEKHTRQLLDYCELPWDESCLSFHNTKRTVRTLSATQVRRPMYKDSVQLWRRYETQLEPLRVALQK